MTNHIKTVLGMFLLASPGFFPALADNPAEDIDFEACYIFEPRKVVDKAKLDAMLADSLAHAREQLTTSKNVVDSMNALMNLRGKQIPSEYMPIATRILQKMQRSWDKDAKKVAADLEKGKLNKAAGNTITKISNKYYQEAVKWNKIIERANSIGSARVFNIKDEPYLIVIDTLENQNGREWLYRNTDYYRIEDHDRAVVNSGWEWIDKEHGSEAHYPTYASIYESHPEFYVKESGQLVFNKDGELLFVLASGRSGAPSRGELIKTMYDADAYGIKKEGAAVRHKIMVSAGLEKMTAAEKARSDRSTKAFLGALGAVDRANRTTRRYGSSSTKSFNAQINALNALSKAGGGKKSAAESKAESVANAWTAQIDKDWNDRFDHAYKMTRVSPTSIRYLYVDKDGVPTHALLHTWKATGKFEAKWSVKLELLNETKSLFDSTIKPSED